MTTDEAIEYLAQRNAALYIGGKYNERYNDAVDMAISALRAQQDLENNEALTFDELIAMQGEPVWIDGKWAIVGDHRSSGDESWVFLIYKNRKIGIAHRSVYCECPAYRHPPKLK